MHSSGLLTCAQNSEPLASALQVNIAAQIYDFIDKHIQHLDDDLKSLGQDIEADKARLGLAPDDSACAQLGVELKQLRGQRKQGKAAGAEDAGQGAGNKEKGKRKGKKKDADDGEGAAVLGKMGHTHVSSRAGQRGHTHVLSRAGQREAPNTFLLEASMRLACLHTYIHASPLAPPRPMPMHGNLAADLPMSILNAAHPAGEHEPVYCQCQRPSHGNMVACDNDECPFEWFHYECVGLTEAPPPDQEWFCPGACRHWFLGTGPENFFWSTEICWAKLPPGHAKDGVPGFAPSTCRL